MSQIIPLTPSPNQAFTVQLQVDGQPLTLGLRIRWSYMAGYWLMAIFNASGVLLIDAVPLITGRYPAANLLAQQVYLKIGSAQLLNMGSSTADYPGIQNLGTDFQLLWDDTPEVV